MTERRKWGTEDSWGSVEESRRVGEKKGRKKARKLGQNKQKRARQRISAMVEYFHIKRACTSPHTAIEYSTRGSGFQLRFAKLVHFAGKMPCEWPEMMCFLFELNKNCAF